MAKKQVPKMYKGKSTAKGMGGKFQMMEDALMAEGKSKASADAIAASAGRKRYGKAEFTRMGAAGRKRAAKKGK
jgi:hypothetical protein